MCNVWHVSCTTIEKFIYSTSEFSSTIALFVEQNLYKSFKYSRLNLFIQYATESKWKADLSAWFFKGENILSYSLLSFYNKQNILKVLKTFFNKCLLFYRKIVKFHTFPRFSLSSKFFFWILGTFKCINTNLSSFTRSYVTKLKMLKP